MHRAARLGGLQVVEDVGNGSMLAGCLTGAAPVKSAVLLDLKRRGLG